MRLPDLHTRFAQVEPHRQFFARENIRILCFFERAFQLMQLVRGEGRATAAHFSWPIVRTVLFGRRIMLVIVIGQLVIAVLRR